ncbi:MAG: hypothetical protein JWQ46_1570 [Phenylobacterium sp.]|nr:hypothetical protein [Phenylobacterium sp.]
MARVAIIGSCITRDLWPVRGDSPEGPLYISRTSFPSLLAAPVEEFQPAAAPPRGLHQHQHRALVADLRKTALAQLVAFRPTHLIFDFIDERFDLLAIGDSIVTHSWELEASGYLEQPALAGARPIPRLSGGCARLWSAAAEEFAALVRATPLQDAQLILHAARWAEQSRSEAGHRRPIPDVEILAGRTAEIAAHNALLARYEAWFTTVMPPLTRVQAPAKRIADESHRWGLSPFHYVPAYYEAIWRQLEALGIARPVSLRSDAPSAPAA